MTIQKKIYDTKRESFVDKTKLFFGFLTTDFEFDKPIYTFSQQSNGVVILDKFEFNNFDKNLKITISNAYHPLDYGFEINLIDLKSETEEMIYYVLKENQDDEQKYLEKASQDFRNFIEERLNSKL